MLLNYPRVGAEVRAPASLASAALPGIPLLVELLEITAARPDISPASLVERFRERPEGPHLEALLADEMLITEDGAARELADNLARIVASGQRRRLEELVAKASEGALSAEEKEELRHLRRHDTDVST